MRRNCAIRWGWELSGIRRARFAQVAQCPNPDRVADTVVFVDGPSVRTLRPESIGDTPENPETLTDESLHRTSTTLRVQQGALPLPRHEYNSCRF